MGEEQQSIKIDLSDVTKLMEAWKNDIVKEMKPAEGKGVVSEPNPAQLKLMESLKKVQEQGWRMTEQWTVVIPVYTTHETAAHMRDHVFVSNILQGNPGDVANYFERTRSSRLKHPLREGLRLRATRKRR